MDAATGALAAVYASQSMPYPRPVAASRDGALFAYTPDGYAPAIVSTDSLSAPRLLQGTLGYINGLSLSPDHSELAAIDQMGNVVVWRTDNGARLHSVRCGSDALMGVSHLGEGALIAASYDGVVYRLAGEPLAVQSRVETDARRIECMSESMMRGLFCLGFNDGHIEVRNAVTLELVDRAQGEPDPVSRIFFDASGKRLFTFTNKSMQLWLLDDAGKLHDTALDYPIRNVAALCGPEEHLVAMNYWGGFEVRRAQAAIPQLASASDASVHLIAMTTPGRWRKRARLALASNEQWLSLALPLVLPRAEASALLGEWGFLPGDTVNTLRSSRTSSLPNFRALLEELASAADEEYLLVVEAARGNNVLQGRVQVQPPSRERQVVSLSNEDCEALQKQFVSGLRFVASRMETESLRRTKEWEGALSEDEGDRPVWITYIPPAPAGEWIHRIGLSFFDRIVEVDGKAVGSPMDVIDALEKVRPSDPTATGKPVQLRVNQGSFTEKEIELRCQ